MEWQEHKKRKQGGWKRLPYLQNMELIVGSVKQEVAISDKVTEKIDGAVAVIMALNRVIRCVDDNGESVYFKRGIMML